jgi:hypothetical protein
VELYRETGEPRYLDLAGFLLDQRGYGWLGPSHRYGVSSYFQDRVPIRESSEVEGHAVRALYLTAGVADVYLETGEQALFEALQRQFHDMVSRKLYLTGGVGSRHLAEAFGKPYELPNELAYCETCAAIASIMWCWRMLLITGESRFADLAERTLYNAVLSGVSLDGDLYFYVNPLADNGETENLHRGGPSRKPWHNVACCPPNVMRLVASLGHYAATGDAGGLQIHQYGAARIAADLATGGSVALRVESDYPWDGRVRIAIEESGSEPWTLSLRIPAWSETARVQVVGEPSGSAPVENGYARLERDLEARRRRRDGPRDDTAPDRGPSLDRVDAWQRGDRARAAGLLSGADRPAGPGLRPGDRFVGAHHRFLAAGPAGRRDDGTRARVQDRPVGLGGAAVSTVPARRIVREAAGRADGDPGLRLGQPRPQRDEGLDPGGMRAVRARPAPRSC